MDQRILIIGAGPAGMKAALTLHAHGHTPTIIDEAPASGGQIFRRQPEGFRRSRRILYGFDARRAGSLHAQFDAIVGKIDYRPHTVVWDVTSDHVFTFDERRQCAERIDFDRLILATGATDRTIPIAGWTLPGVFTLGGAQICLKYQGCAIGRRVVFMGTGPLLYLVAYQYLKAGAKVAAVLDTSSLTDQIGATAALLADSRTFAKGLYFVARIALAGVPIIRGITPIAMAGEAHVEAVRYKAGGREVEIPCDAVAFGFGLRSETQLHDLAGLTFHYDHAQAQWLPDVDADGRCAIPGLYVCGDGAGIRGADACAIDGELAAWLLLEDIGQRTDTARCAVLRRRLRKSAVFRSGIERAFPFPHHLEKTIPNDTIVCRCEAVSAGQIRQTVRDLGAIDINRAKAFSRAGMGRCQGRFCGLTAASLVAAENGTDGGRFRCQPPIKPIPMDVTWNQGVDSQ
jgi:hydrogen cyanide synthase HcnB